MAVYKCKMCGGDLHVEEGATTAECEFCGTLQTVPSADDEKKATLFNRANRLRRASEFDKAAGIYESIVADFPEEAEAYWGLVLCKYGIEYVDDPKTGKKIPTCHRTIPVSIFDDDDFEQAQENADSLARSVYREEAKEIDRIQQRILEISAKEEPYDVFICYKETDDNGERTSDSVLAQEIYDSLAGKGLKAFFSRITLEDKLGQEYEPYIYAALSSAKVMLAVGTKYDYFNAVWVKNEWARYLAMMAQDKGKTLIPCYKDVDAYDMPREFKNLQAQDMNKLGWLQDLTRGVMKLCGKDGSSHKEAPAAAPAVNASNPTTASLLQRAELFLGDKDFKSAKTYADRVLDLDPQSSQAYLIKVLATKKAQNVEDLKDKCADSDIDKNPDIQKAIRFSEDPSVYLDAVNVVKRNAAFIFIMKNLDIQLDWSNGFEDAVSQAEQGLKQQTETSEYDRKSSDSYKQASDQLRSLKESAFTKCIAFCDQLYESALQSEDNIRNFFQNIARKTAAENKRWNEEKAPYEQNINKLNDLKKERQEVEKPFTEKIKLLKERIEADKAEFSHLGIFAGKRKKELSAEIEQLKHEIEAQKNQMDSAAAEVDSHISEIKTEVLKQAAPYKEAQAKHQMNINSIVGNAVKKGQVVEFGSYKQTGDGQVMPIQWIVLNITGFKLLMISKYGLDQVPYSKDHKAGKGVTWETCALRKWLNSDFYNTAFNDDEKKKIEISKIDNPDNERRGTPGGNSTQDKLFLLSIDEVLCYFSSDEERKASQTEYAKSHEKYSEYFTRKGGKPTVLWWLRSPGDYSFEAAFVDHVGCVVPKGGNVSCNRAVRPALWINLESDIF